MSFQAGVQYFDTRPVTSSEATQIFNRLCLDGHVVLRYHLEPGLLLAQADRQASDMRPHGAIDAVTFDGRLDNRDDLLQQLNDSRLAQACDAALALAVYQRWGATGLVRLIGDWSLVIWDADKKALLLASDFAGVRPLYYRLEPTRVCWSTRLAGLTQHTETDAIDDEYIATLLGCLDYTDKSPYCGVCSVPPGHAVLVRRDGVSIERFWIPPIGNTIRYKRESDYEDALASLFRDAVRCRLPDRGPAISDLSGGLDSSSIVSMARRLSESGCTSRLVTISIEHPESIDAPFYELIEKLCDTEAIHLSTDRYAFLSEAFAGATRPAPWQHLHTQIAKVAQELGGTVYLTGQLGDFIMGNRWDDSYQVSALLRQGRIPSALHASLAWSKRLRIPVYWVLWRALLAALPQSDAPIRVFNLQDGSYASRSGEDSIAASFRKRFNGRSRSEPALKGASPERRKHVRELWQILQSRKLQPPEPLEHLDYTHPYSHRPLVEYMLSIPADIVCGPGEPRRLMRRTFHDLWPPELRRRHSKDSFGGVLLNSLRPLATKLAQSSKLLVVERGYVEQKSFEKRLRRMALGLDCNEPQLRQIMMLELWLRRRRDRSQSSPLQLTA